MAARRGVGSPGDRPGVAGCSPFRDDLLAALERPSRFARRGWDTPSPRPGAQGVRMGTAVHAGRASQAASARRRQWRGRPDRRCPSRPLRRCDAGRRRPPLPGLSCRRACTLPLAGHARSDRLRRAGAASPRRRCLSSCRNGPARRARAGGCRRGRSGGLARRPAPPGGEQPRSALPARPLAESAHHLVTGCSGSVGAGVWLLARPGGRAVFAPRCAGGRLLIPAGASISLRRRREPHRLRCRGLPGARRCRLCRCPRGPLRGRDFPLRRCLAVPTRAKA
jgi:hypothetical protein